MNKIKILVVSDASFLSSGYGVYTREILSRFAKNNKYSVAELACYTTKDSSKIKDTPWKVYPNAVSVDDPRFSQYNSNKINQFGAWRFERVVLDFKPDVVVTWTDPWMYSYQEHSPLRKYFSWIQMPMVDSSPPKIDQLYTYCNADIVIPYTLWAKNILQKYCGNQIKLWPTPANAGINPNKLYPVEDKRSHKKQFIGDENKRVIGTVMRNQKRKLFSELFIVFRDYLNRLQNENKKEEYEKTILYLHTSYPEEIGWNFPGLLIENGLCDKVVFSYLCNKCGHFFVSKFKGSCILCENCGAQDAIFPSVNRGVDDEKLNIIYNLFDFYVQYANCEGFGMPVIEAASCGVPFASVDYSAMSEIAENLQGIRIPIKKMFREIEGDADRAYPDNDFAVNAIYNFFIEMNQEQKNAWSNNIRNLCIEYYTWDKSYSVWEDCISKLYNPNKQDWNRSALETKHSKNSVPNSLNDREFIEYICNNIIVDNKLFQTSLIQSLVKDSNNQIIVNNGIIKKLDRKKILEALEIQLNKKIICEELRTNPEKMKLEDFI
jgi:glycosyltransferase involved in cell wall biosynthesis